MPSENDLIDSHVSESQCKRAIEALCNHQLKKEQEAAETELLPAKDQHVWLIVAVKKISPTLKIKPYRM